MASMTPQRIALLRLVQKAGARGALWLPGNQCWVLPNGSTLRRNSVFSLEASGWLYIAPASPLLPITPRQFGEHFYRATLTVKAENLLASLNAQGPSFPVEQTNVS